MSNTLAHRDVASLQSSRRGPGSSVDLSIVMPCLNESETLEICICEAKEAIAESDLLGEIVIADNGSTDGSQQIATELGARVINVKEKGYGNALRGGILASRGLFVVMADSDASYDFGHAPRLVEKLREGYDLVMGNRFLGGIQPGAMPWKHRYIGNPILSGIGRLLFNCPAGDFHCGLRGFRRSSFEQMDLNTSGMEFASEMLIKATLKGMRVVEIPTVLRPDGRSRRPHLRSWRDGWRHLRFMLMFSPRWLFMIPGGAMMTCGLLAMVAIAKAGSVRFAGVGLNINTCMASAMFVILGTQLVFAGAFARQLGTTFGALPPSRAMESLKRRMNLEVGVVAGLLMTMLGTGLLASAWFVWRDTGYGQLDAQLTVRRVIPAVTLIILGVQTVFWSFFMNLIRFSGVARRVAGAN